MVCTLGAAYTVIDSIALHVESDDPSYEHIVIARHAVNTALGVSVAFFEGTKTVTRSPLGSRNDRIALGDYASNLVDMSLAVTKFLRDVNADSDCREVGAIVAFAIRNAADTINTFFSSSEFKLRGSKIGRRADA